MRKGGKGNERRGSRRKTRFRKGVESRLDEGGRKEKWGKGRRYMVESTYGLQGEKRGRRQGSISL